MKNVAICSKCGSDKVQTVVWQRINTDEFMGLAMSETQDANDNWCEKCEDNCTIIDLEIKVNKRKLLLL